MRTMIVALTLLGPIALCAQTISSIEINQAIGVQKNNARKFVAGKNTVVRALLAAPVAIDGSQTNAKITRDGKVVTTLAPNAYDAPAGTVDFQCPSLEACGGWAGGSYLFEVTVNNVKSSTAGTDYLFQERAPLRILAVPVKANYGGTIVPVTDNRWLNFWTYMRDTYPVAADKLVWIPREELDCSATRFDLETESGRRNLWEALEKLVPSHCNGNPQAEGCFQQVFGFIMSRPRGFPNGVLQGYTYGKPANIGVITDEDAAATVAHEIAHTYDLGDTYNGGSFNCSVNPAANEYVGKDFNDASLKISCTAGRTALEGVSGTRIPASVHPYEVGGRGALPDMAEYMGSGGKQAQFWTTQDGYDWIFDKLAPPAPAASLLAGEAGPLERRIEVFGLIRQSAAVPADVTMEPWWSFTDNTPRRDTKGRYTIAAVSASGVELSSTAIRPNFDPPGPKGLPSEHVDPAPFEGTLGFPTGTVKFVISRDGKTVREIPVSANAPVITSVAPQARGSQNGAVTITWDATDADRDELEYEVEYNPDVTNPSLDWEVLSRDLTDKQFTVDFSRLAGGAHAYIRISATDGINATDADSAEFVVPAKAPSVFIDQPLAQARFLVKHEIVLRGTADDLQDNEIPNARLQWSSSLSGSLGAGAFLKVAGLPAGTHVITLTATNSFGLKESKSVTIVVSELAPVVTSITPSKGSSLRGAVVTITGNNFRTGATVKIGGAAATSVVVVNATTITAMAPAATIGAADVVVTNSDGQAATLSKAFSYTADFVGVAPSTGPTLGGTRITLSGSGFAAGMRVVVGGNDARSITIVDPSTATALVPPHSKGAVDVTVVYPSGTAITLTNAFIYRQKGIFF